MAIAKVKSVTNSCFIDGNPATKGQMINYGTVIETYDIKKGLVESLESPTIDDDGYLSIEFIEKKEEMSIKPHCKVIFKANSRGLLPTPKTVELDPESKIIASTNYSLPDGDHQHSPHVATVAKVRGQVQMAHGLADDYWTTPKEGERIYTGDIIKVGGVGYCIVVFIDDKSMLKITNSSQFQFMGSGSDTRTISIDFGTVLADVKKGKRKDFRITTPSSVAAVKG